MFFQLGGIVLALYGRDGLAADSGLPAGTAGAISFSVAHNVRDRDEVDAILASAERAGGTVTRAAHAMEWGGYAGYFTDPDGNPWEVAWNPGWEMDAEGRVRLPQS